MTKETSQILLQRLWHLRKSKISLASSLWGDSFTDVGYNIGQVETLLGCSYRYHCVFWTALLSTSTAAIIRTCYSGTRRDYLIIKFTDDMKICLFNETKSLLFHLCHKLIHYFIFLQQEKASISSFVCLRKQRYHVTNFAWKTKVSCYKCWRWKNKIIMFASSTY